MQDFTLGVVNPIAFLLGSILILILPGPNMLNLLSISTRYGTRVGWQSALGVLVSDICLMTLSTFGLSQLLQSHPGIFSVVKTFGSLYLLWMAFKVFNAGIAFFKKPDIANNKPVLEKPEKESSKKYFYSALIIGLLNPKALFFFLAFFVQFIDFSYPHPMVPFLVLGIIFTTLNMLILISLLYFGAYISAQFRRHRKLSAISNISIGMFFVLFSIKLVTSSIN